LQPGWKETCVFRNYIFNFYVDSILCGLVGTRYWIIIFHCSFQCQNPYAVSPSANAAPEMSALVVNPDVSGKLEMDRAPMMLHTQGSGAGFD
jgi:hypothetical protein